jgi:hypothetical protein
LRCVFDGQERAKEEVILSLIPLLIFIVFVLYAFCRLGVFAVCNPLKAKQKKIFQDLTFYRYIQGNLAHGKTYPGDV